MDAIKYICGFSLFDEFPPTPLLERYLSREKEAAKNIRKEGSKGGNFLQAQDKAIRKEVVALNTVIDCIKLHRLESQYSPENLKTRIEELSRQRSVAPAPAAKGQLREEVNKRSAKQSLASGAQLREQDGRKRIAPDLDPDSNTPPQQRSAKKICRDHVSMARPIELPQQPYQFPPGAFAAETAPYRSAKKICRDHVSMGHPIESPQQPYQHPPGAFAAETAPYLNTHYAHYSLGASSPVPTMRMSPIRLEYGSGTPSRGFPPFSLVGSKSGSVPNFNAKPYTVAGTPHYSLS